MNCIFCDSSKQSKSVEHIIPESLGNKRYILEKGQVCDECNNKFSSFEKKALTRSIFLIQRIRTGVATKRGKNAQGVLDEVNIQGDSAFRKGVLNVNDEDVKKIIRVKNDGSREFLFKAFDKSEVSVSKMLLKIGFESLFKSKKEIFQKYDFTHLRNFF